MNEPEWKTKRYTITGWIGLGVFISVMAVDLVLVLLKMPTFSNYISRRAEDQQVFGWIVFGGLVFLILHFLGRFYKRWIRKK